jgi:hypothetical protein
MRAPVREADDRRLKEHKLWELPLTAARQVKLSERIAPRNAQRASIQL